MKHSLALQFFVRRHHRCECSAHNANDETRCMMRWMYRCVWWNFSVARSLARRMDFELDATMSFECGVNVCVDVCVMKCGTRWMSRSFWIFGHVAWKLLFWWFAQDFLILIVQRHVKENVALLGLFLLTLLTNPIPNCIRRKARVWDSSKEPQKLFYDDCCRNVEWKVGYFVL